MVLQDVIGYLAGVGTTLSFFPQMVRVIRTGSVGDLSVFMFLIHSTGVLLWVFYGFMINNIIIIFFNSITLIFNFVILMYFIKDHFCKDNKATIASSSTEDEEV